MSTGGGNYDRPPIDFVCRRLIIKFEPVFNVTHRYLYCQCLIRLSTPSHLYKELTLLTFSICPRHNRRGACYQDYGNIDYHQLRKRKPHESLRFAKREAAESSRLSGVDPPKLISRSVGT